jgi:hypothetical protein
MSEFFRMPAAWHTALDSGLPHVRPIDNMIGTLNDRIGRRLLHCLAVQAPIKKSTFCKQEGIKLMMLNSAVNACTVLLWEDDSEIGLYKGE